MVHSDFIAVHRSTSANASLSHQLYALRILVHVTWVATQRLCWSTLADVK